MKQRKLRKGRETPQRVSADDKDFFVRDEDEEWNTVRVGTNTPDAWNRGQVLYDASDASLLPAYPPNLPWPLLSDADDNVVFINQQGIAKFPRYAMGVTGDLSVNNFCYYYISDLTEKALEKAKEEGYYDFGIDEVKEYFHYPYMNVKAMPKDESFDAVDGNFYQINGYNDVVGAAKVREAVSTGIESMRTFNFAKTHAPKPQPEGTNPEKQLGYSWKFSPRAFRDYFDVFYPEAEGNGEVVIYNDYTFSYTGTVWVRVGENDENVYFVKLPEQEDERYPERKIRGEYSFFDTVAAVDQIVLNGRLDADFEGTLEEKFKAKEAMKVSKKDVASILSKANKLPMPTPPDYPVENGSWEADSTDSVTFHNLNVFSWYRKESHVPTTFKRREIYVMRGHAKSPLFEKKKPLIFLDQLGIIPIRDGRFLVDLNEMKIKVEGPCIDDKGRLIDDRRIKDNWISADEYLTAKTNGESFSRSESLYLPPNSDEITHVSYKNGIPSNLTFHYIPNKRWCTFNEDETLITCTRMIMMDDIYNRFVDWLNLTSEVGGPYTNVNQYVQNKCYLNLLEPWDSLGIPAGATIDIRYFPPKFNNNMNSFMPAFLLGGLFLNHDAFIESQRLIFFSDVARLINGDEQIHPQQLYFSEKKEGRDLPNIDKLSLFVHRLEFFFDLSSVKRRTDFDGIVFGDYPNAREDKPSIVLPAHLTKSTRDIFAALCSDTVAFTNLGRHNHYAQMTFPVVTWNESITTEMEFIRNMTFNNPLSRYLDEEREANLIFDNFPLNRKDGFKVLYPGFKREDAFGGGIPGSDTFLVRVINDGNERYEKVKLAEIIDNNEEQTRLFGRSFTYAERRFFKTTLLEHGSVLPSIANYYDPNSDFDSEFNPYLTWYLNSCFTIGKDIYSPAIEYYGGLYYRFEMEDGTIPESGFNVIDSVLGENETTRMKLFKPFIAMTRMGGRDLKIKFKNNTRYPYGSFVNHAFAMEAESIYGAGFQDGVGRNVGFLDRILEPKRLIMKIEPDPTFDYKNHAFSAFHWRVDRTRVVKNDAFKEADGPSSSNNFYSVPYLEWNGTIENSFFRYQNKNLQRSFCFTTNWNVSENDSINPDPINPRHELTVCNPINGGETPFGYWKVGITDERGRIIKPNAKLADVLNKVETAFYPPYVISHTTNNLNEDQPYYVMPNEMRYFRPDKVVERDEWFKTIPEEKQFRVTERVTSDIAKQISDFFTCTPKEFMETYIPVEERGQNVVIERRVPRSFPIKYYFTPFKTGRLQTELIDLTGVSKLNKTKLGEYTPYTLDEDMDNTIRLTDDYGLLTGSGLTYRPSYRIRTNIDSNNTHRILVKNFDKYGLPVSINKVGVKDVFIGDYWDTYKLGVK